MGLSSVRGLLASGDLLRNYLIIKSHLLDQKHEYTRIHIYAWAYVSNLISFFILSFTLVLKFLTPWLSSVAGSWSQAARCPLLLHGQNCGLVGRHLEGITTSSIFVLYRDLHWAFKACSMCLYNQDLSEHISMLHSFVQLPNAMRPNEM